MVLAHLRKGETYRDLAVGFGAGHHRLSVPARSPRCARRPGAEAGPGDPVAARKAYVVLDGTLLRIDRVAMASGNDRAYHMTAHHGAQEAFSHAWRVLSDTRLAAYRAATTMARPTVAPDISR